MTPDAPRRVVQVVPDVAGVRKAFDYVVPPELGGHVRVGTSVRVRLHNRRVAGWVVADDVEPPAGVTLQPILAVRGWGPPPVVVTLARWAAWRWAGPPARLLGTASAPSLVRSVPPPPPRPAPPPIELPAPADPPGGSAVFGLGVSRWAALAADAFGGGERVVRLAPAHDPMDLVMAAAWRGLMVGGDPHGADPPGVLVLAPAQDTAARVASRMRRAGFPVALLPGQWAQARAGGCVAVGSRAGAFAPLPVLGAAVVLDAHDETYYEERAPTWCAWEVVAERARREGVPCALVSSCPTQDLLHERPLVTSPRVDERSGWPAVEVVDRRADDPRSGLYSERLVRLLRWAASAPGRRVLCVLNRTGRIRLLICATCGDPARCERCGAAVESAATEAAVLHCPRCGLDRPHVCANCGSTRLAARRVGVSRVREELEALAKTAVAEVTGDHPRSGAASSTSSGDRGSGVGDAAVVVGTEAVLHRVEQADAVAFLDFDAELLAPRLRAAEEALALLARAARIVARGGRHGDHDDGEGRGGADGRAPG
ncbi:MAG TPA: hypothetical protein VKR22_02620, partial [Acidimicrobiales bacterium]|nr:hypothetical protein [Acidimicrobiales bacterium]